MKLASTLLTLAVLLAPALGSAQESNLITLSPTESAVQAIQRRVSLGDKQALRELATLDPEIGFPKLANYMSERWSDPEGAEIARETLASIKGHGEHYRQKIAAASGPGKENEGFERVPNFRILAALRSREAVKAVAFFLFDETTPRTTYGGDVVIDSNKSIAVSMLAKMRLPDAPTHERSPDGKDADVLKWRAWWTAHQAQYQD